MAVPSSVNEPLPILPGRRAGAVLQHAAKIAGLVVRADREGDVAGHAGGDRSGALQTVDRDALAHQVQRARPKTDTLPASGPLGMAPALPTAKVPL